MRDPLSVTAGEIAAWMERQSIRKVFINENTGFGEQTYLFNNMGGGVWSCHLRGPSPTEALTTLGELALADIGPAEEWAVTPTTGDPDGQ